MLWNTGALFESEIREHMQPCKLHCTLTKSGNETETLIVSLLCVSVSKGNHCRFYSPKESINSGNNQETEEMAGWLQPTPCAASVSKLYN